MAKKTAPTELETTAETKATPAKKAAKPKKAAVTKAKTEVVETETAKAEKPKKATKVRKVSKSEAKAEHKPKSETAPEAALDAIDADNGEVTMVDETTITPTVEVEAEAVAPTKAKATKVRGYKYQAVRAKVDKTKVLTPTAAVELVKKLSYSKFSGSLEVHAVVKEVGQNVTVTLPHSTGKTVRVAIASDELLAEVEAGKIEFDVLLSTPQFMGKLAKLARVLGPKGLMPNPKNGTLTDNPERKAKELAGGAMTIKTEKKAPLMHVTIGKLSMESAALTENLEALLKALRGKLLKVAICGTMSPSVKVVVEQE